MPARSELLVFQAHMERGEFYEAHEVVEEVWHRAAEPYRTFLKGLIHVAVALAHWQRGNLHGARVKSVSARRYLEPYLPHYSGVELEALLAAMGSRITEMPPPGDGGRRGIVVTVLEP